MAKKKNNSQWKKDPLYNKIYMYYDIAISCRTRTQAVETELVEPWLSRRIKATYNLMPFFLERYAAMSDSVDIVTEVSAMMVSASIILDELDRFSNFAFGAARWMLDEFRKAGNLEEAKTLLKPYSEDSLYMQIECVDPCYSDNLIGALMYIICNRDADANLKYANNYLPKLRRQKIILSAAAAAGDTKSKLHDVYRQLLALIPEERKTYAVQQIKSALLAWLDVYMEVSQNIKERHQKRLSNNGLNILANQNRLGSEKPGNDDLFNEYEKEKAKVVDIMANFLIHSKKTLIQTLGSSATQMLMKIELPNPYVVCFGLFYMIETDDDLIWTGLLALVAEQMITPKIAWLTDYKEELLTCDTPADDASNEFVYKWHKLDYCSPDDPSFKLNLAQIIRGLTDVVIPMDEDLMRNIKHTLMDCHVPEDFADHITPLVAALRCYDKEEDFYDKDWDEDIFYDDDICDDDFDDEEDGDLEDAFDSGKSEEPVTETAEKNPEEEIAALQAEIKRLKHETDNLKSVLHETSSKLHKVHTELEEVKNDRDGILTETCGLREIVFAAATEDIETESTVNTDISFPYTAKGKAVVFGGHESWVREMKLKLPGIRFVDRGAIPNVDLIRNAGTIWIQTNAIPHRSYNAIINEVRRYNIPLQYFTYTSAAKCAVQFAEYDRQEN